MSRNPRDPAWAPSAGAARVNAAGGTVPGRTEPRPFRSAAPRGRLLRIALFATVLLAAFLAAVYVARMVLSDHPTNLPAGLLDDLAAISTALALASVGLAAITLVLWMAWSSRVEANAPTIGAGEGAIGPAAAILWWFVPFANLIVPFGLILGLGRRLSDDDHAARDGLIVVWWLTLLGSGGAVIATWIELQNASGDAAVRAALLHAALAQVAWLVAAVLAIAVVRYIQGRENLRASRLPGWGATGPNVLAPVPSPGGTPVGLAGAVRVSRPATPTFPSIRPVPDVPAPARGSPADLRFGTRRRRSGGLGWALFALLIVGFVVLPRLLAISRGSAIPVASAVAGPTPLSAASRSPRPSVTPTPTPLPSPSPSPSSTASASASRPSGSSSAASTAQPSAAAIMPLYSPPTASSAPAYLLDHVAAGDGTCAVSPSASLPSGALAMTSCDPAAPAVATLEYAVFATPDAARSNYDAAVEASGVAKGTGNCFQGQEGETGFLTDGQPAGRVLCSIDRSGGSAVPRLVWIDERLSIVGQARASGNTLGDVFDWWTSQSGPV